MENTIKTRPDMVTRPFYIHPWTSVSSTDINNITDYILLHCLILYTDKYLLISVQKIHLNRWTMDIVMEYIGSGRSRG